MCWCLLTTQLAGWGGVGWGWGWGCRAWRMGGKEGKSGKGEGSLSGPLMACSGPGPCTLSCEGVSELEPYTVVMFVWTIYLS